VADESSNSKSRAQRFRDGWINFVQGWPTALLRQWPLLVVMVCFLVGICLILAMHWRRGAMMIGGGTGLAALLRLVLPDERAGLLVVRSRFWDVFVTGLGGAAMIVLAWLVPPL